MAASFCPEIEAALGDVVRTAQQQAACAPLVGADPKPRWTLRHLVSLVRERLGRRCCRETIRAAPQRLNPSWKRAKKPLDRANPERRAGFIEQLCPLLEAAQHDRHLPVCLDKAHIHQDVDLGHGWGERGKRFHVASASPSLAAKVSFHGRYPFNEGQVRSWPYARANGEHTIDAPRRLRAEFPGRTIILIRNAAPWHRAKIVWPAAVSLDIHLIPLPGHGPGPTPVEPLWRWLREDGTYHHCHATADDLIRQVAAFKATVNQDPCAVANRLWVKDHLDPKEKKLRCSG